MRPLRLAMTAFGPFPTTEEVDFRELRESRLFLIHGETGAGKSTILDGICTALYGESAGGERTPEEMRSDHAAPDLLTELELDFCIGEKAYRIHRIPKQERPKKRGKGMVDVAAEATLWELESAKKGAATGAVLAERKVKMVAEKVVDLLGLQASQFRQVVVLPQGQFRRLLTASSAEREEILEKLFDTATYLKVERKLLDRKKALGKEIATSMERRKGKLGTQGVDSIPGLEAKIEGQTLASRHLDADAIEKSVEAKRRVAALQEAVGVAGRFAERDAALVKVEQLNAEAEEVEVDRGRLVRAKGAAGIEPSFERMRDAEKDLEKRAEAETKATREAAEAVEALAKATEAAEVAAAARAKSGERRSEREQAKARAGAIRQWKERVETRERAEKALATTTSERESASRAKEDLAAARKDVAKIVDDLKTAEVDVVRAEGSLETAKQRVAAHVATADVEKRLFRARETRETAEATRADAQRVAAAAKAGAEKLEAAHESGSAAILAIGLAEGAACPVCGSTDHPRLAKAGDALPSDDERKTAASARDAAQGRVVEVEGKVSAAMTQEAGLAEELKAKRKELGDATEAAAKKTLDEAEVALASARERGMRRKTKTSELERLDASAAGVDERARAASEAEAKVRAELEGARAEVTKALEAVGEGERDLDALEARAAELGALIEAAEKAHEVAQTKLSQANAGQAAAQEGARKAGTERREAESRREERKGAWRAALLESEFDDLEAFEAARLDPAAVEKLDAKLKRHGEEMAAAKAKVATHDKALEGARRPELESLKAAATAANAESTDASERVVALKTRLAQAAQVLTEVVSDRDATAELEKGYSLVGRLANVAVGENGAKLSLHRFVLAAFLDDVLIQASHHLLRMSRGRYQLARRKFDAGSSDRRKKHGLDLDVSDHYTGEHRPATTLSGGEGFLAALALALGLADVVQAHAGGIRLETVFVDEGFGSLDPETLDLAVDTLLQLQETGRLVGVISHVGELKERIDVRLEVSKTEAGSETRFQLPN